jgi:hypothetical protein
MIQSLVMIERLAPSFQRTFQNCIVPPLTTEAVCGHIIDVAMALQSDDYRWYMWIWMYRNRRDLLDAVPSLYLVSLSSMHTLPKRLNLFQLWDDLEWFPEPLQPQQVTFELVNLLLTLDMDKVKRLETIGQIMRKCPLLEWPSVENTATIVHILTRVPDSDAAFVMGAIIASYTVDVPVSTKPHTKQDVQDMMGPLLNCVVHLGPQSFSCIFQNWPAIESTDAFVEALDAIGMSFGRKDLQALSQNIDLHNKRIFYRQCRETMSRLKDERLFAKRDAKITLKADGSMQDPLDEARLCVCCQENKRCITFDPCSHFVLCAACSAKLNECPICKTHITKLVFSYLS